MSLEIEKKFVVKMPNLDELFKLHKDKITTSSIIQTYLTEVEVGVERRVRQRTANGKRVYYYTEKKNISKGVREENEREITLAEYIKLLTEKDANMLPIIKDRYVIDFDNRKFELDIYTFWDDKAILEIELPDINEQFEIPTGLEVIADATGDKRYSNKSLASNFDF